MMTMQETSKRLLGQQPVMPLNRHRDRQEGLSSPLKKLQVPGGLQCRIRKPVVQAI